MTANETPLDLERLREVAEGATPGSWQAVEGGVRGNERRNWVASTFGCINAEGNGEHIATFDPPTVLALIKRLERAEAVVERVRALADRHRAAAERRGYRPHEAPLFALLEALDAALAGDEQGGEGR